MLNVRNELYAYAADYFTTSAGYTVMVNIFFYMVYIARVMMEYRYVRFKAKIVSTVACEFISLNLVE